jgi:hypothetical protein
MLPRGHQQGLIASHLSHIIGYAKRIVPTPVVVAATAAVAVAATATVVYKTYPLLRNWQIRNFAERNASQMSILDTEDIRGEILDERPALIVKEDKNVGDSQEELVESNDNDLGKSSGGDEIATISHGADPRPRADRYHRVKKGRLARKLAEHLRQFTTDGHNIDLRVARHEGYKWFKGTSVRYADREPILCAAIAIVTTPAKCHRELAAYQQRPAWVDWIVSRRWDPRT